jgi:CHAD domain-containing protein
LEINEYYNYLKEKETVARKKFLRVVSRFDDTTLTNLAAKIAKRLKLIKPNLIEQAAGQNAARSLMRVVARKSVDPLSVEELHSLRMDSKDARYRIQVLSALYHENEVLKHTDSRLRTVHQSIGNWHDYILASEKLESFLTADALLPLYSENSYLELKSYFNQEAGEHFKLFHKNWNDIDTVLSRAIEQIQTIWPFSLGDPAPIEGIRTCVFLAHTNHK